MQIDDINEQHEAFSRNGLTNPMGKLQDELKTKVDPDTALLFRKKVHGVGTDSAGALRDFVYKVAHGETYTDMCIREAQVNRGKIFGTGLGEALSGALK